MKEALKLQREGVITSFPNGPSRSEERSPHQGPRCWNPCVALSRGTEAPPSSVPSGSLALAAGPCLAFLVTGTQSGPFAHFGDSNARDKAFCFWNSLSRSWTPFWSHQKKPSPLPPSRRLSDDTVQPQTQQEPRPGGASSGHSRPGNNPPPQPAPTE